MPCIRDKSTVEAIARGFIDNDRNKTKGLLNAGYAERYALTSGQKLYEDLRVIKAIARIDKKSIEKSERTVESIDKMQQAAYDLAMEIRQPSAAVSAGTAIARLYGLDKDASGNVAEEPKPLSPKDLLELKRMVRAVNDAETDYPKLAERTG